MLITGTSDKIQFKLGSSATTQLSFTVDYSKYTSTSVTPLTNNGTSNNTTAVDLVTSPGSGQQHQLRYCSIYNSDSSSKTVIIQVYDGTNTRIVFRAVLSTGDLLQYQLEKGWEIIDSTGNKKTYGVSAISSSMRAGGRQYRPSVITGTATLASQTIAFVNLGRAEKSYSTINLTYNVTTAAAGVTWAEIAIYAGSYTATEVALFHGRRVGYIDVSTIINTTGVKNTQISVSGINPGDVLRAWFGSVVTTTQPALRNIGYNVDLSDHSFGTFAGVNNSARLSGVAFMYAGAVGSPSIWTAWQGN